VQKLQRFLRCKRRCLGRFCISLISIPEHQNPSQKAISAFVRMLTTHLCEGFLHLSKQNEKGNSIKDVDPRMRESLEIGLKPGFSQLVDEIQRQQS